MKIKLRQVWFAPDGGRLRPNRVHDVPDEWHKQLPKTATVVEAPRGSTAAAPQQQQLKK